MNIRAWQRVFLFLLFFTACFNGIWWLAWPVLALMVFSYNAYEAVLVGFLIDVYFAPTVGTLYYTGLTLAAVIIGMALRPLWWRRGS